MQVCSITTENLKERKVWEVGSDWRGAQMAPKQKGSQ